MTSIVTGKYMVASVFPAIKITDHDWCFMVVCWKVNCMVDTNWLCSAWFCDPQQAELPWWTNCSWGLLTILDRTHRCLGVIPSRTAAGGLILPVNPHVRNCQKSARVGVSLSMLLISHTMSYSYSQLVNDCPWWAHEGVSMQLLLMDV